MLGYFKKAKLLKKIVLTTNEGVMYAVVNETVKKYEFNEGDR
jgi:hypothetical protein